MTEPPMKRQCTADEDMTDEDVVNTAVTASTKEKEAFEKMEYSSAKESTALVMKWLEENTLGDFVNNKMVPGEGKLLDVKNPANGDVIVTIPCNGDNIDAAINSSKARNCKENWLDIQDHIRARYLYSVTREVQKHGKMLAVMESLCSGVVVRECRDIMLSDLVQTLYHYTGWSELASTESKKFKPYGLVGILLPEVASLTAIAQQVVPALAAGNCVIMSPLSPLPALLFAKLCCLAGLPAGAVSVVLGLPAREALLKKKNVQMVTGSLASQDACKEVVGSIVRPIPVFLSQVGKSSMIILDNCDIDSAVSCVAEKAFFSSGQSFESIGRILVQTSCYNRFCKRLRVKFKTLRLGDPLDGSSDIGCCLSADKILNCLELQSHLDRIELDSDLDSKFYVRPCVLLDVQPSSDLWRDEILGPVAMVTQFRTVKEAVTLVNHSKQGVGCSLWSEKNSLIMQVAKQLNVGNVWVNCHDVRDATRVAQYRSCTGSLQVGGEALLRQYMTTLTSPGLLNSSSQIEENLVETFGKPTVTPLPSEQVIDEPDESINKTIKLFIGGTLKRASTGSYFNITSSSGNVIGSAPYSGKKDVRDAVEAANKALPGWSGKSGFNRSQILYFLAENICKRKEDFAEIIAMSTGRKFEDSLQEVDTSIQRMFMAAAWSDKVGGSVWNIRDPVGVIGITAPAQWPMLGLCSLLAPAIAAGNTVVVIPSDKFPIVAVELCSAIATSDVPGGVVNVLYGEQGPLSLYLTQHNAVNASWYFGYPEGCYVLLKEGVHNNKQVWVEEYDKRKWNTLAQGTGYSIYHHCYNNKHVFMPSGSTFAN